MCSLHLTRISGAVGSRHCGSWGAVGGSVPCLTSGFKSNALSIRPRLPHVLNYINNADKFSQPSLIIFTKGADIFGHDCVKFLVVFHICNPFIFHYYSLLC